MARRESALKASGYLKIRAGTFIRNTLKVNTLRREETLTGSNLYIPVEQVLGKLKHSFAKPSSETLL